MNRGRKRVTLQLETRIYERYERMLEMQRVGGGSGGGGREEGVEMMNMPSLSMIRRDDERR